MCVFFFCVCVFSCSFSPWWLYEILLSKKGYTREFLSGTSALTMVCVSTWKCQTRCCVLMNCAVCRTEVSDRCSFFHISALLLCGPSLFFKMTTSQSCLEQGSIWTTVSSNEWMNPKLKWKYMLTIFWDSTDNWVLLLLWNRWSLKQKWARQWWQTWARKPNIPSLSTPSTPVWSGTLQPLSWRQVGVEPLRIHRSSCASTVHLSIKALSFSTFASGFKLPCHWGGSVLSASGLDVPPRENKRF